MKKASLIILLAISLFTTLNCKGQPFAGMAINTIGIGWNGGYKFENMPVVLTGGIDFNPFSISTKGCFSFLSGGIEIAKTITPSVGIGNIAITEKMEGGYPENNYIKPYFSLMAGRDIKYSLGQREVKYRPYLFTTYCYKMYGGIGLRIYIQ